jgi:hypothetical protein
MNPTAPSTKFDEDFVDGLPLGNGTVDNLGVNVIIDHDALRGSIFFVGAGDVKYFSPAEEAENMRRDFQNLSIHETEPRLSAAM